MDQIQFIQKLSNTPAEKIVLMLTFLSHFLEKKGEKNVFGPVGLTKIQYNILNVLEEHKGKAPLTTVSKLIVGTAPNLSGILRRMEKEKLIERNISPKDRREIMVFSTKKGKEILKKAKRLFSKRVQKRFSAVSKKQNEQILKDLSLLAENILF